MYAAFGVPGYLPVCIYFLFGSLVRGQRFWRPVRTQRLRTNGFDADTYPPAQATKVKPARKRAEGIAEARLGRRSPVSVVLSSIRAAWLPLHKCRDTRCSRMRYATDGSVLVRFPEQDWPVREHLMGR